MLFGDKEIFAIECDFYYPRFHLNLGHVCLWIHGEKIGDYDDIWPLEGQLREMRSDFLRRPSTVMDKIMAHLEPKEALKLVWYSLYNYDWLAEDESLESTGNGEEDEASQSMDDMLRTLFSKYLFLPHGACGFETIEAILIPCDEDIIFVWRCKNDVDYTDARYCRSRRRDFEPVMDECMEWFKQNKVPMP